MTYHHTTQDDDPTGGQATSGSETEPGQAPAVMSPAGSHTTAVSGTTSPETRA